MQGKSRKTKRLDAVVCSEKKAKVSSKTRDIIQHVKECFKNGTWNHTEANSVLATIRAASPLDAPLPLLVYIRILMFMTEQGHALRSIQSLSDAHLDRPRLNHRNLQILFSMIPEKDAELIYWTLFKKWNITIGEWTSYLRFCKEQENTSIGEKPYTLSQCWLQSQPKCLNDVELLDVLDALQIEHCYDSNMSHVFSLWDRCILRSRKKTMAFLNSLAAMFTTSFEDCIETVARLFPVGLTLSLYSIVNLCSIVQDELERRSVFVTLLDFIPPPSIQDVHGWIDSIPKEYWISSFVGRLRKQFPDHKCLMKKEDEVQGSVDRVVWVNNQRIELDEFSQGDVKVFEKWEYSKYGTFVLYKAASTVFILSGDVRRIHPVSTTDLPRLIVLQEDTAAPGTPLCLMCDTNPASGVWMPCGHRFNCRSCELQMNPRNKCPICARSASFIQTRFVDSKTTIRDP
jgi:hypothetical protein